MKKMLALLALLSLTLRMPAQTSNARPRPASKAPLLLFVDGPGNVVPFHDGQMLEAGRDYVMTANPDRGQKFANWSPVTVFTMVEYVADESGDVSAVTNTVMSPEGVFSRNRTLRFQVQPAEVILEIPGVKTVMRSSGWQANFVPRK